MRIDSVSPKADRTGQYYLTFSDGSKFRVYPQTMAEFSLYEGRELSEEELKQLRAAVGAMSAKMRAVRIVSASSVSARDLEERLRRKGETKEDAKAAVSWMQDLSFVDDLETARQVVRRGIARGYGKARLRQMLYEKRIPKNLWEEAMEDIPEPDEAILSFLDSRLGENPDEKELKKTIDALLRRGHAWQDIRRCLAIRGESMEHEPEEF